MAAPPPLFSPPPHGKPKLSAAFLGQVLLVTLQAVATVAIVAVLGAFLAIRGWLTKEGKQLLSRLSMNVTIPCLLFSQVRLSGWSPLPRTDALSGIHARLSPP